MFNVTIIKLRDVAKIVIVLIAIYIFSKFVFKNISIKNYLDQSISINTNDFLTLGIDTESEIIKSLSKEENGDNSEKTEEVEEDLEEITLESILQVGMGAFGLEEKESSNKEDSIEAAVNVGNSNETVDTSNQEASTDVTTKVVTANPIAESYNREYGNGIKIKNETSYELTDDMLNPGNLEINTDNVLIFHTHTCESYTQSENYTYEPSR